MSRPCLRAVESTDRRVAKVSAPAWRYIHGSAEEISAGLGEADWKRLSAGTGTQGPRLSDRAHCELADREAAEFDAEPVSHWTRGLLTRSTIADGALAFFSTWCPRRTGVKALVHVEGHRWPVEDDVATGKTEFGLDHNETQSWHGWHRHVSLNMPALAMMRVVLHRASLADHPKNVCGSVC
jgi:SRSO17 transposase